MWRLLQIEGSSVEEASVISRVEAGCILCHSGKIVLAVNGVSHEIGKGSLFIYPPYANVTVEHVSSRFGCTVCEVGHEFVLSAMKTISWSPRLQFISRVPVVTLPEESSERINELIPLISRRIDDNNDQFGSLSLDCLQKALAYEVFRAYMESADVSIDIRSLRDSIVVSFQEALKNDAVRHRNVKYYAQLQGLTPRYFSTAIRELTGYPPLYWITRAVVVEARHMMLDSTLSLKEITYRLNFTSQTFFSRWYRQYSGETPSQFRRRNKIN